MKVLTSRLYVLILLACLQAAHGAFSGFALCREDSGKVAMEWARGGQCESIGGEIVPCSKFEAAGVEHCETCLDVPFPSEASLKSPAQAPQIPVPVVSFSLWLDYSEPSRIYAALPALLDPFYEHLSSIRLLI